MSEMVRRVAKALAYDVRPPADDGVSVDEYWAALDDKDRMWGDGD